MAARVRPFLREFTAANVPMEEVIEFYGIDTAVIPVSMQRPYTWSNTVATIDGFMNFDSTPRVADWDKALKSRSNGENVINHKSKSTKDGSVHGSVESDVALKRHPQAGPFSLADYRLLNAGWIYADAVLSSGPCLRVDPFLRHVPVFEDMLSYRKNVLGKSSNPIHIVLTSSATSFDYTNQTMFNAADLHVVVITTPADCDSAKEAFILSRNTKSVSKLWSDETHAKAQGTVRFVALPLAKAAITVDLTVAMHWLRTELDVHCLEIDAGGSVVRRMIDFKLLDEVRLTQTGQLIGSHDETGSVRPSLFGSQGMDSYDSDHSVIFRTLGIRAIGDHHLFLRYALDYRH
ncbi:hypothetical protein CcCBS67573_g00284 [Chytriomyces confervae]|uniref:2,5-diamino-6-ribosylamino-4(3H)-pyrimidinone 5'-phosphate reductase n=1 Tax=Chytriomyces confervae TaxID=246404 RepID=A0A507FUU3_9FUNG|nr:hypothetical protein HDU80_005437 [Chytriomyces hyalinus]TPX78407.1 hypothetical protein CcCBS67573_g00284 [Chytriomyces confervae]